MVSKLLHFWFKSNDFSLISVEIGWNHVFSSEIRFKSSNHKVIGHKSVDFHVNSSDHKVNVCKSCEKWSFPSQMWVKVVKSSQILNNCEGKWLKIMILRVFVSEMMRILAFTRYLCMNWLDLHDFHSFSLANEWKVMKIMNSAVFSRIPLHYEWEFLKSRTNTLRREVSGCLCMIRAAQIFLAARKIYLAGKLQGFHSRLQVNYTISSSQSRGREDESLTIAEFHPPSLTIGWREDETCLWTFMNFVYFPFPSSSLPMCMWKYDPIVHTVHTRGRWGRNISLVIGREEEVQKGLNSFILPP